MSSQTCQPVLVSLQLLLSDVRAGRSRAHASASTSAARRLAPQRSQQLHGVAASARTATVAAAAATARRRRVFVRRRHTTRLPVSHAPALSLSSMSTVSARACSVADGRPHLCRRCRHRRRRRLRTATRSSSASTSAATPSPTASPSTPRPTCSPSASSRRSSPSAATSGESPVVSVSSCFSHRQRRQLSQIVCLDLLLWRFSHRFLTRLRNCCCMSRSQEFQTERR